MLGWTQKKNGWVRKKDVLGKEGRERKNKEHYLTRVMQGDRMGRITRETQTRLEPHSHLNWFKEGRTEARRG